MFNPFTETAEGDADDSQLVARANCGDRKALEELVHRHQAWIYNIALRMVYEPQDAEDVTQEVLVKVITKLGSFQGDSKFRTWLYRVVANHVLNMQRRGVEARSATFAEYGEAIDRTPDLDLPDAKTVPVDVPLLVEEAKLSCTTGMLLCLDRRQRLVFTLGEILGASDRVGGEILEMTTDNFRQCLARARRDLFHFMNDQCGLVNKNNPCRCPKKTSGFIKDGHVDPNHLRFASQHVRQIKDAAAATVRRLEDVVEGQYAAIFREQPFLEPPNQVEWLRQMLERPDVRMALRLN